MSKLKCWPRPWTTTVRPSWATTLSLAIAVASIILWSQTAVALVQKTEAKTDEPTKIALIETLRALFPLLERKDYQAAAKYFVVPPNFKPEMLDGFIERREISSAGIDVLEKQAAFGTATKVFGKERAQAFAKRVSVDVQKCYGFNHETKDATGEVIALWDGSNFKLIRLDDVGKFEPMSETPAAAKIDKQKIAAALPALESAVNENPKDVAARANYAMALYQVGNLPAAISQLLAARKLQPDHAGVNRGISVVLGEFEKRGLFSVGVPSDTIQSLLGDPEQVVDLSERTRWVYAFMGIDLKDDRVHEVIDLRGATEELFRPTEIVTIDLDGRGWRCGIRKKARGISSAVFYLPGESIAEWNERVDIERRIGLASAGTIEEIGQLYAKRALSENPDAKQRVLESDDQSVIIAFVLPPEAEGDPRHVLVRLFKGPVDVHRIAYTLKTKQPSQEQQKKWLGIFKAAKLKKIESGGK